MTKEFKIGKTYTARSACDHNCIFAFTVVARTAKQITIESNTGSKKVGVTFNEYDNCEMAYPLGRYSMAPSIQAITFE